MRIRLHTAALVVGLGFITSLSPAMGIGDHNGDGKVDSDDGTEFLRCFAGLIEGAGPGCEVFDFDGNDRVDLSDFTVFQTIFGMSAPVGMAIIPGGEFEMGCHAGTGAICRTNQLPVHEVCVDSFYMDVFLVTNDQYRAYLTSAYQQGLIDSPDLHGGVVYKAGGNMPYSDTTTSSSNSRIIWNASTFGVTPSKSDHPMITVTWVGAAAYANWRSVEHGRRPCYDLDTWVCDFSTNGYRLPTEAQWEYAARGGERNPYYGYPWGNDIDGSMANYSGSGDPFGNLSPQTTPVGYYDGNQTPSGPVMVNGFGLYDMAGNVSQWCYDRYNPNYYQVSPYDNPQGPATGSSRLLRGGSWFYTTIGLRCAFRDWNGATERFNDVGFRVVAPSNRTPETLILRAAQSDPTS